MTAHKSSHLVPKLRFPEFQRAGDWKRAQIGNIASITKGKRASKADITKGGATPCIRYAELYTHYREVIHEVVSRTNVPHEELMLSQAEDVIVPASGETRVDIARAACVLPERVALGSDLNILRSDLYGPFFSYLLNSPLRHTIARMAQGDTVAHLYPKQLSRVWLAYPLRLEQQKIADCLGSLDDLIVAEGQKLEALRQHKQGLMQQLFPQPGEIVPRLRFPEFEDTGEWDHGLLKDFVKSIRTGKLDANAMVEDGDYRFYTCAKNYYWINDYAFDGEALLIAGNGAYLGYVHHYTGKFNAYQRTYVLQDFKIGVPFLKFFLDRNLPARIQLEKKDGNTPYIVLATIAEMPLLIPPTAAEQQRIATCLALLEDVLAAQARKIDSLKQQKKGLLQQLFPSLEGR